MKKIILVFLIYNSSFSLDMAVIPTTIIIIADELKKIDEIVQEEEKKEVEDRPSNCPSGSSTKVKVALISASATVLSAIIYLIIHLTK